MAKSFIYLLFYFSTFSTISAQSTFYQKLADSALTLTKDAVVYDGSYYQIKYPNGDVPANKGVCIDVVIRAYRKMGIDLQKEVHEDMKTNFAKYPKLWGLSKTDSNIDHRRVPNLMTFFERKGIRMQITNSAKNYLPGDIVCWNLDGGLTHIGIVSKKRSADGKRNLIIHNIGAGQVVQDCLFKFKIIGHFRYEK